MFYLLIVSLIKIIQVASYCSIHAMNAMLGSIQLGCSPEILHKVEKTLHRLERTQPTYSDAYMDHQVVNPPPLQVIHDSYSVCVFIIRL